MKILITGGLGFIGSHVCELLVKKNYEIIILDNCSTGRVENISHLKKNIQYIKADISKKGSWSKYFENIYCVIHLAALADIVPSIQNPVRYYESNVNGTLNVMEACKKYKVKKLIYSASSSCYGIPKKYPTKETSKISPKYPYALTKRLGEEIVMHWSSIFKIDVVSLRFFNVYGTRSRTSGTYGALFGVLLAQKLANKPYTIVGDGNQTRDFTYVSDIASAVHTILIGKSWNQIYNVGSGKTVSVNKIVKLLGGKKVFIPKRPGEPDCTFADINKIKRQTKWRPKINIEKGIKILIKDILYWKNAPIWTPELINKETEDWFKYIK